MPGPSWRPSATPMSAACICAWLFVWRADLFTRAPGQPQLEPGHFAPSRRGQPGALICSCRPAKYRRAPTSDRAALGHSSRAPSRPDERLATSGPRRIAARLSGRLWASSWPATIGALFNAKPARYRPHTSLFGSSRRQMVAAGDGHVESAGGGAALMAASRLLAAIN